MAFTSVFSWKPHCSPVLCDGAHYSLIQQTLVECSLCSRGSSRCCGVGVGGGRGAAVSKADKNPYPCFLHLHGLLLFPVDRGRNSPKVTWPATGTARALHPLPHRRLRPQAAFREGARAGSCPHFTDGYSEAQRLLVDLARLTGRARSKAGASPWVLSDG